MMLLSEWPELKLSSISQLHRNSSSFSPAVHVFTAGALLLYLIFCSNQVIAIDAIIRDEGNQIEKDS